MYWYSWYLIQYSAPVPGTWYRSTPVHGSGYRVLSSYVPGYQVQTYRYACSEHCYIIRSYEWWTTGWLSLCTLVPGTSTMYTSRYAYWCSQANKKYCYVCERESRLLTPSFLCLPAEYRCSFNTCMYRSWSVLIPIPVRIKINSGIFILGVVNQFRKHVIMYRLTPY